MDRMVNYILLTWKLECMLRTYRTCNSTVGFLKYEFNNKLLGSVTIIRPNPIIIMHKDKFSHELLTRILFKLKVYN